MTTPAPDTRMRELARQHRMTYRIRPEWGADRNWNQQRVGFELELHAAAHPDAAAAMREVAQWAFPDSTEVCFTIDEQKGRLQGATEPDEWTAVLTAHVLHCGDVRRPLDGGEHQFVLEVKRRLGSLGMSEK